MEIRGLRYFLAVAREENITRAAESLHLSQPALSRQLADLEEELGKPLLHRGKRRITLTEEGLLLKRRAQEIIDMVEKTENELIGGGDELSGDLYIGGGEAEAIRIVARAITRLHSLHPQLRFHMSTGVSGEITEKVSGGLLDFGVVNNRTNLHGYDYLSLPGTDTWGILARSDSPIAKKEKVTAVTLQDLPLLISRYALTRGELSGWVGKEAGDLNIVATFDLIRNASQLVREGMGYALCYKELVENERDLTFLPFEPAMTAGMALIWKKHQTLSRPAKAFLDTLQAVIAEVE